MEEKMLRLHTKGLCVGYERRVVLEDVELSVNAGEVLVLIGPNGAGKSTVLKSLVRELRPLAGTVFLDRQPMEELTGNQIARKMSILMTGRMDAELMTCGDVVGTGRYPYTGTLGILSTEDRRIVDESMEAVHVSHLKDTDFHQISDGQRQRVLLARAICQEPDVLILDEPTSFLDIRYKLELLSLIRSLVQRRQIAVILSLHELELVRRIADRVLCIRQGRVDRIGTPEEVFCGDYIKNLYGIAGTAYDDFLETMQLIRHRYE